MSFFFSPSKKEETPKESQKRIEDLEKTVANLSRELKASQESFQKAVSRVGIVRFNPFSEKGSDQSFSVAFLNQHGSGIIVTSHFFKEYNRMYAKPIFQGKSEYPLSEEEKKALEKAMQS